MKLSLIVSALLTLSSAAFARDPNCPNRLESAKNAVAEAQQKFEEGTGTRVGILSAKSAQADVFFDCVPFVKYKYCERKLTLLNSIVDGLPALIDNGQATQAELDAAKKTRSSIIYYCTHPAAPKP